MQRRAAAIYVALFVLVGAASYSLIATAQQPTVEFEEPTYELTQGDQLDAGGQTYTVVGVSETGGELEYTNESDRYTATWENDSTQTVDDEEWRVVIAGDDPTEVTLREAVNESALLAEDPDASDETVEQNGTRYVVINNSRLVSASEYFPEPETRTYTQGDTLDYRGNTTTVDSVTADTAELVWTAPRTNTVDVGHEANVTIGDQTQFAYVPDGSTIQLIDDYSRYRQQTAEIDQYQTYRNGLWGVSIVSLLTAVFMTGFAYLPSRY
ncbi:hypothetical protein GCM10008995_27880 [Halobellus salinus]|uniref:Uncharacterized protein n=1 Tax=Halobellus salinus TaxID=931585 RepID=A0A830EL81_9EURY|nr:hypothetical protein [Halobellus salinus]GGJ16422.1 hypothetical protein GCM10008995_27880 [Halobellus salinus]SMP34029.1 hypothetical protein SAMN06265347_12418 [Halobellus salinus]